ncbi:Apoptosis regulator protein Bcl-2 family [Paragonimus heterotremus]|uniref:Apoptosis regulator protein Bcl-2 family n=1 Tax=Paragonimus heterotremus TaxID=100268 RepID=A0A8J4T3Z7_9TREM|nr:Apoptosis regulator protein Bcl-2 family [Paragonimus heterotremus]
MLTNANLLEDDNPSVRKCEGTDDTDVTDYQTQTIIEEFVQYKLRSSGKHLQRRSGPADVETQLLVTRLIEISNDLEIRYGAQLNRDAEWWIQSATFEKFVQIAKGVFSDGQISWSRIVVLFMFAVKVVFNAFSRNLCGLAQDVIKFAAKFIFMHGIYKWIEARGGWLAVLQEYSSGSTTGGILVFMGVLLMVLLVLKRSA